MRMQEGPAFRRLSGCPGVSRRAQVGRWQPQSYTRGMFSRWADEFERMHRSLPCLRGSHGACPHLCGLGDGLNPGRLRLEFGAALCKCDCHTGCPLAGDKMAVPVKTWRDLCSCPGAEAARQDLAGAPDFDEYMARFRRDAELRRDADEAVRAQAAGRSREEVRDLYISELRSRGLPIPSDDVLDAKVDAILGDYLPAARLFGQNLADLARFAGSMWRALR